jgi:hypothetical protein
VAATYLTQLIGLHELDIERAHIGDSDLVLKLHTRNARVVSWGSNISLRHQSGLEDNIVEISIQVTTAQLTWGKDSISMASDSGIFN